MEFTDSYPFPHTRPGPSGDVWVDGSRNDSLNSVRSDVCGEARFLGVGRQTIPVVDVIVDEAPLGEQFVKQLTQIVVIRTIRKT